MNIYWDLEGVPQFMPDGWEDGCLDAMGGKDGDMRLQKFPENYRAGFEFGSFYLRAKEIEQELAK